MFRNTLETVNQYIITIVCNLKICLEVQMKIMHAHISTVSAILPSLSSSHSYIATFYT